MSAVFHGSSLAILALLSVAPAAAQEVTGDAPPAIPVPVGGAERYTPADFTRFAPRTALDMVEKVPG